MTDSTLNLNSLLLRSENYRDFLVEAFRMMKATHRGFSFARLAKKIGCRSKSYPRDVMIGRRSLSLDYADPFAQAFGLSGEARRLFIKMVEYDRATDMVATDKLAIEKDILKIRKRLGDRIFHKKRPPREVFAQTSWIDVYAALGSTLKGATLSEVCARNAMPEKQVQKILAEMVEKKIIELRVGGVYMPMSLHHFFEGLDQDVLFQERYLEVIDRLKNAARSSMKSESSLFFCSTFSLQSKDLPRFKSELRELLNKFVEDCEFAEGDKISHLVTGFI